MATLEQALVISNEQMAADLYELEMIAPQVASLCKPGQFLQVRMDVNHDPLLRRRSVSTMSTRSGDHHPAVQSGRTRYKSADHRQTQESLDIMGRWGTASACRPSPFGLCW